MKKFVLWNLLVFALLMMPLTGCTDSPATAPATDTMSGQTDVPATASAPDTMPGQADIPTTESASDTMSGQTDVPTTASAPDILSGQADIPATASAPDILSGQADIAATAPTTDTIPGQAQDSGLTVHFLDVGQGDSTLIICDGEAMLVDAGDNNMGTTVQLYLTKQNVNSLKYVIGTHPDSDHIGGLDVILYKFDCDTVIMPDKSSDTATYRDVIDTMESKGYQNTLPATGDTYTLGSASFTILGPSKEYGDDNNCSVAFVLTHGENSFLFVGDAEQEAEDDIVNCGIDIDVNVYKVGHHGSSSSTGTALLEAATPEYAVISCGKDNPYGHPHAETLNNLRAMNIKVFRTDEQGSITVTSDGKSLIWNCSPSETWQVGEQTTNSQNAANPPDQKSQSAPDPEPPPAPAPGVTYILNTNTKKFHYPSCSSVNQMKDKNKQESNESRDVIIGMGYEPCKRCKP